MNSFNLAKQIKIVENIIMLSIARGGIRCNLADYFCL